ncbi:MAG: DNA-directed polymerase subunit alpha [Patescibacteria group bacterium]|nr:DNA-directed polymerase subunit alpha [Patescibacteria group bacterium]
MSSYHNISLPSKPKIVKEENTHGIFEIDGLYPGYGHTLGNSLRRVILSSIPGVAATSIKIEGIEHEFSAIKGVKEDVIAIILNLKKVKFAIHDDEPVTVSLSVKGPKVVTAADLSVPTQATLTNQDQYLFEITDKASVDLEFVIEKGLGFVPREMIAKNKAEIGTILLDAAFTPIRRVSYEVENMRVGDRTDHNRLRINIETDGSVSAKEAFESSIKTMINQLQSVVGFKEFSVDIEEDKSEDTSSTEEVSGEESEDDKDVNKTKIEDLGLSTRTVNTLLAGGIKTLGGITKRSEESLNEIEGMGAKGIEEIKEVLASHGLSLK